ncbi:MAG: DUF6090 family protein [Verrucomicrobia bacterium]|nr:DUF6090 family protein [Verrucomicrobiota bacterium]MDA1068348.1 DUF6090 family protein [Verrucomicrobiota bacterium]
MLFIFRKLRRSFFLPGKVRTYVAYAIGEIFLIVVGILIAVQIGEWNQARKDYAEETAILIRLKADFEENRELLKDQGEYNKQISEGLINLLAVISPQPDVVPEEVMVSGMISLARIPFYNPQTSEMDSLTSSGKMVLIKNEKLSRNLNTWEALLDKAESHHQRLREISIRSEERFSGIWHWKNHDPHWGPDPGPSHFSYDQQALLAMPELESAVYLKLDSNYYNSDFITRLSDLQQSILDLIDTELASR